MSQILHAVVPFKERVRREREQEILDAARDEFATHGFERTSIDAIAERVGISKGTVYLHFPCKEDILRALLRRMASSLVAVCQERIAVNTGARQKLETITELLVESRFTDGSLVRVLASEVPHFMGTWRQEGVGDSLWQLIADLIRQGQAEGDVHPEIDPAIASKALLLITYMTAGVGAQQLNKQEVLAQVSRLFFHGITTEAHS